MIIRKQTATKSEKEEGRSTKISKTKPIQRAEEPEVEALSAERLNQVFRERADIFEYPSAKVDWKTPQHVEFASKIESKK